MDEMVATQPEDKPKKKIRLFPLHMTSFEHYMFVDDRQLHPMTFVVQFEFAGKIDREAFDAVSYTHLTLPTICSV